MLSLLPSVDINTEAGRATSTNTSRYCDAGPANLFEIGGLEVRGQQNEDGGDQEHPQILLELDDVLDRYGFLVGQRKAHDGDRQQAGFGLQQIGAGENPDDKHHRDGIMQIVGDVVPLHAKAQNQCAGHTQRHADRHDFQHDGCHHHPGPLAGMDQHLKHQHGEHGANGVNDDAFPLEDGTGLPGRADEPQHGSDHGRAGDDQDCAEQDRQRPVESQYPVRSQAADQPGDGRAQRDQPGHNPANGTKLLHRQAQPAFKQNHRYRQRDHGMRIRQPSHWAAMPRMTTALRLIGCVQP